MDRYTRTQKSRVRRLAKRGVYERTTVHAIIDEALVCHVGFVIDGEPRVLPTAILRIDENVYLHGNRNSQMLRHLESGAPACIEVTHVDGLVAARSGFHCSMNYRSVVIYASGEKVEGAEKLRVMDAFVAGLIPGHHVRPATRKEIAATTIVRFPLHEVSAKVRTGGPVDDEADYALDTWAGVIPLRTVAGRGVDDERLKRGIALPRYASRFRR